MSQQMHLSTAHPSLALPVTEPQRERALTYLQGAYADGRLSADELDLRVGKALLAHNRAELNQAFAGLVTIPLSSAALGAHPAYAPLVNQHRDGQIGRGAAGVAHFSALATGFVGPAITYALTTPGTFAHREAARAFNTQIAMSVLMAGAITAAVVLDLGVLMPVVVMVWLVMTVVGGAKAASGEDSENLITRLNPLKLLNERQSLRSGLR